MNSCDIAVIAGDGVGPEVIAQARKALEAVAGRFGFKVAMTDYDLGGQRWLRTGEALTDTVLEEHAQRSPGCDASGRSQPVIRRLRALQEQGLSPGRHSAVLSDMNVILRVRKPLTSADARTRNVL